jgi:aryl-alcohol dehydrogenase-like predicted oxidoreductase
MMKRDEGATSSRNECAPVALIPGRRLSSHLEKRRAPGDENGIDEIAPTGAKDGRSTRMRQRKLGSQGLSVSEQGLGCMGMSDFYGQRDEVEAVATIHRALDLGIDFLDTSDMYGPCTNEELIGRALKGVNERVVVATKFGIVRSNQPARGGGWAPVVGVNGRPEYVRAACDASLKRLGRDHIDLYYQHRVDVNVPIEETVGAMADLVRAGKVLYLGLSEASAATIRRAHAVHPLTAVQSEYSLWSRDVEDEILPTLRELGIGFVAYSPLGRGFLTGELKSPEHFAPDDYRRNSPRFMGENFARNLAVVERVKTLAAGKGVTPGQLALAWVLAQGEIVPIPGTKRRKYLEENVAAGVIALSREELAAIAELLPKGVASGERYPEYMMAYINR